MIQPLQPGIISMAAVPPQTRASAWLSIDLAALAANYRLFKNMAGATRPVAGVIKADGYGLGVARVLAALENENCPFYFVATLEEALTIRPLTQKPVAVLGGLYHGAEQDYIHHHIVPVLNSLDDITRWQHQAAARNLALPCVLHFDTGMNRLGLGAAEAATLRDDPARLGGLAVLYAMSHFACADDRDHPLTRRQYERFLEVTAPFPGFRRSLANSSGAFRSDAYHLDMLRPGMALYGLNPTPETANPMKPVVRLDARILQIRTVQPGETVGYSATYRFDKNALVATAALGYADGFLRSLGDGQASVYYRGVACPVIGRVSMDAVSVDVTRLDPAPAAGESFEILGSHQDADTLAAAAGTIGYEILTSLGRRYHRIYTA